jgi:hypothetical protein
MLSQRISRVKDLGDHEVRQAAPEDDAVFECIYEVVKLHIKLSNIIELLQFITITC